MNIETQSRQICRRKSVGMSAMRRTSAGWKAAAAIASPVPAAAAISHGRHDRSPR